MQVLHYKFCGRVAADPWFTRNCITFITTCTYRSDAEQAALYAQGRTAPGPIVTNAKPGHSKHNIKGADGRPASEAFDIVPLRSGKPVWGTEGDDLVVWQRLGGHGKFVGLKWYGEPDAPFHEFPHFQNPQA